MSYSRFNLTNKINYEGHATYGSWKKYSFLINQLPESSIGVYIVDSSTAGRPDLISNRIYGATELDWVLLAFNNVRDTLNWPEVGELVRYPAESIVIQEVFQ